MFHLLSYYAVQAAAAALADTPMVVDGSISLRNGHPIFTEKYEMAARALFGASITAGQLSDATWNAINTPQIYPANRSLAIPANPQIEDLRDWPIEIPLNEEIALQLSNNLGAATEPEFGLVWIRPLGQTYKMPDPAASVGRIGRVRAIFTFTTAITAGVWTSDVAVTITNLIKGGSYCMAGCDVVVANGIAFRWNFVRAPLYNGRKLFPGSIVTASYGNVPIKEKNSFMGPFGYFDTFELPLISVLAGTTTGSTAYTGYMDLIYMGMSMLSNTQPGQS